MQLDELTQQNAALVEEATAASQTMAEQAKGLNDSMQRFHVKGSAATSAGASAHATHVTDTATAAERRKAGRPWTHVIQRPRKRRRRARLRPARTTRSGRNSDPPVLNPGHHRPIQAQRTRRAVPQPVWIT